MTEFLLGMAAFLILLAVMGALADDMDRRDARQRNQARRLR